MASNNPNNRTSMNQPSKVVKGRVISGDELREYAERNGLCPKCGMFQTHKKTGHFLKPRFEPMTVTNAHNQVTVYKGYCIAPTCYTLERAKQLLGEIPHRRTSSQSGMNIPNSAEFVQAQNNNASWGAPPAASCSRQHPPVSSVFSSPSQDSKTFSHRPADESVLLSAHSHIRRLDLNSAVESTARSYAVNEGSGHRNSSNLVHNNTGGSDQSSSHRRTATGEISFQSRSLHPPFAAAPQPSATADFSYSNYARRGTGSHSAPTLNFKESGSNFQSRHATSMNGGVYGGAASAYNQEVILQSPLADSKQRATSSGGLNVLPPLVVGSDRTPSTISEHTEMSGHGDPLVRDLEEKIRESNYVEFLNLLDDKKREPLVVLEGFRLLRFHLAREHMLKPDGVVLVGENWAKVINEKIRMFAPQEKDDRLVVISGLVTILTISRQGLSYKRILIRKDAMELIMKLFEDCYEDADIMNAACAVVISLSMHEKHNLNAKSFPRIATLIRKLAYVVLTDGYHGKAFALRALLHISNQRKKSETTNKTALHDVRNAIANEPTIRAILETIQSGDLTPPLVEAGLVLLWKICRPKEEDPSRVLGTSVENINSVVSILEQCTCITPEVLEASCGLLANLAFEIGFPADLAHRVVTRICDLLANPDMRTPEVANVAVHAFCNLFAKASSKAGIMAVDCVVHTTVLLLKEYPEEEEVVEYSCLAISHAALGQPNIKRYISGPESFPYVQKTFQLYVLSRSIQPSLPIKDAALCAFASISGCDVGAKALMDSGLAESLSEMHTTETDPDFRSILEVIHRNISAQLSAGGINGGSGLLRQQPAIFQQLLRNAVSEEDVLSLVRELREIGEIGLPALGNHGFDELLNNMSRYEYSSVIQQEICSLLAEIYYLVPLTAVESPTQLPGGSWAVLHRKYALDLLCNATSSHPEDCETQISSTMALTNLLSPLCELDLTSPNVQQVQAWLSPVWRQTLQALSSSPLDCRLQEVGLHLCWALTILSSEDELIHWVLGLLQHVFDTMARLPDMLEINITACDILLELQTNQDSVDFMGNSNCVEFLVNFLDQGNADLAVRAVALLSVLSTQVFVAVGQLVQVPNIVQRLIDCMNAQQAEPYVAIHTCIILETLINFEDVSLRYTILENGGMPALCTAMEIHQANPILCKHACRVLTLVIPYTDPNALWSISMPLESVFLPLLQVHANNPDTEAAILDLLWAIGSMDDYFKSVLLTEQNLQVIIQAMRVHLGSDDMQRSGCGMLWLLSGFGDGKRLIGSYGGIQAILNAMLLHCESTSIQKEGLTALKNLATESSNKPILAENDCVRVVTYSLWINYQHPLVISSALSALNNIAIDSRTKSVAPLPPEILGIVLSAMRRFPLDEMVQKNACFYLKSCTYLAENRVLMGEYSTDLYKVLQQASENFPQTCQERAQSILKKIQG